MAMVENIGCRGRCQRFEPRPGRFRKLCCSVRAGYANRRHLTDRHAEFTWQLCPMFPAKVQLQRGREGACEAVILYCSTILTNIVHFAAALLRDIELSLQQGLTTVSHFHLILLFRGDGKFLPLARKEGAVILDAYSPGVDGIGGCRC